MKKIAIYGAGGFGREVAMLIGQINAASPRWEIAGFFDDAPGQKGRNVAGLKVLGGIDDLNRVAVDLNIVLALGNPPTKRKVFDAILNPHVIFPSLVHPGVIFPPETDLGLGCIICAGSILTVNVKLEDFVMLNLRCTIGHDTRLGAFTSVMPGVAISGEVRVGSEVYIGTGASVLNGVEIGSGSVVGAGAVVNRSLPDHCTAVGVPARVIKTRTSDF